MALHPLLRLFVFVLVSIDARDISVDITIDHEADMLQSPFGNIRFVNPAAPTRSEDGVEHPAHLTQPFSVEVSVELSAAGDFSDWLLCYSIDEGSSVLPAPYCMAIILDDGMIRFSPLSSSSPPELDALSESEPHLVIAWFASISSGGQQRWGLLTCPFTVSAPVPRHSNGEVWYIADDDGLGLGDDKDEEEEGKNENKKVESKNSKKTSTIRSSTPTVAGVMVEPREQPAQIASVLRNVMEQLPAVRPIHLFHGKHFDPCAPSPGRVGKISSTSSLVQAAKDAEEAAATAAAAAASAAAASTAAAAMATAVTLDTAEATAAAALAAKGALAAAVRMRVSVERSYLCSLIESEAVVAHPLTVDNLTYREYNRLLKSVAFWSRLAGSDKILVFQTDVAVCSGGAWQLQQQHEQLKVGEGGDGDDNSDERSETTTTRRSMSSIRAGGGGGGPPKLVRDFASKLDYVGGRQLLEYFVGSPPELVVGQLLGGNGGFSMRDYKLSMQCAKEFAPSSGDEAEDNFFPKCIKESGGKVASWRQQDKFCSQTYAPPYSDADLAAAPANLADEREEGGGGGSPSSWVGSLGTHKPFGAAREKVLMFCPELQALLDLNEQLKELQ